MAAKYIPYWEIIEYAHSDKRDAASGTTRVLVNHSSDVQEAQLDVPLDEVDAGG